MIRRRARERGTAPIVQLRENHNAQSSLCTVDNFFSLCYNRRMTVTMETL